MAQLPQYFAPLKAPVMAQLPQYVAPVTEDLTATPEPSAEPGSAPTPSVQTQAPAAAPQSSADDDEDDGLLITPASSYATPSGAASGNPLSANESNTLWPNSMTSYSFSLGPNNGAAILGGVFGTGYGLGSGSGK